MLSFLRSLRAPAPASPGPATAPGPAPGPAAPGPDEVLAGYLAREGPLAPEQAEGMRTILQAAFGIGHEVWPLQVRDLLPGRDVLDVGCGHTFYGAFMRALGARSYTGTEPRLDLGRRRFRSKRPKGWVDSGISLADVVRLVPRMRYLRPGEDAFEACFDLALMHTVTEHLLDIDAVFRETARALRPGGTLWFLHDNFAAWAGHHMAPRRPGLLDEADPEHALYSDWRHLRYQPDPAHPFVTNLNRIRVADLRAATERHFRIESWEEVPDEKAVARRLTPAIEAALPGFSRRELLTRHVICRAVRR